MNDERTSNEIKQQLSDLMDGELDAQRTRFLLRRLAAENQAAENQAAEDQAAGDRLAASWSRWHTARACLRGESAFPLRSDFASAISLALANEVIARQSVGGNTLRWVGGLAVAASVAVAVLLAVPLNQAPTTPAVAIAPPSSSAPASVAATTERATLVAASTLTERDLRPSLDRVTQTVARTADGRSQSPALRVDPQLASYLLRHNAAIRGNGDGSFLPFVQVAAPVRPWSMTPVAANEASPR
ncbi:MAG: sigma-E factor negative regulatory protein [Pseudomarimonas sp.]